MDHTNIPIVVAIASASVATAGAVVSVASYRLQRRSEKRAALRQRREEPLLSLDYQDVTTECVESEDKRIWRFLLQVTNESDSENSIVQAELQVSCRTSDGTEYTYIAHIDAHREFSAENTEWLHAPLTLRGRESKLGSMQFVAPNSIFADRIIVRYVIAVTDAFGREYQVVPVVVEEAAARGQRK